jgi:hypothetical protein
VGVALLLTLVIEIISCFGLAALRALGEEGRREELSYQGQLSPSPMRASVLCWVMIFPSIATWTSRS